MMDSIIMLGIIACIIIAFIVPVLTTLIVSLTGIFKIVEAVKNVNTGKEAGGKPPRYDKNNVMREGDRLYRKPDLSRFEQPTTPPVHVTEEVALEEEVTVFESLVNNANAIFEVNSEEVLAVNEADIPDDDDEDDFDGDLASVM